MQQTNTKFCSLYSIYIYIYNVHFLRMTKSISQVTLLSEENPEVRSTWCHHFYCIFFTLICVEPKRLEHLKKNWGNIWPMISFLHYLDRHLNDALSIMGLTIRYILENGYRWKYLLARNIPYLCIDETVLWRVMWKYFDIPPK